MARSTSREARAPKSIGIFKDLENDWAFNQTLECMSEKAAETGECLYAARRVDEHSADSWIDEWAALAARVEVLGDESLRGGHTVSAREAYLRACNYWRTAEYACVPLHPRFAETWMRSVAAFGKARTLFAPPIELVNVPFDGKVLPGYYMRPDDSGAPRPTIFAVGGSDSSLELIAIAVGFAAIRRGYNFFTFDFPGHRGAVHLYPDCTKRADYAAPFAEAFSVLQQLPGVDERIALSGYSYGGYVASQVAISEARVKALVADSPLINMLELMRSSPGNRLFRFIPDRFLDSAVARALRRTVVTRGLTYYTLWSWGCPTFGLWRRWPAKVASDITAEVCRISCPTLALVSEHEGAVMMRQAQTFIQAIGSAEKRLHSFNLERDGSYDHCQLDNISRGQQVTFDWLDDVFGRRAYP